MNIFTAVKNSCMLHGHVFVMKVAFILVSLNNNDTKSNTLRIERVSVSLICVPLHRQSVYTAQMYLQKY